MNLPIEVVKNHLQSQKISDCNDNRIYQELAKVYVLIGLRGHHLPSDFEGQIIVNYLRENYAHKGISELSFAFKLAVQNKLDIDTPNAFDQFSILYLEKIMNAYRLWLKKADEEIKQTIKEETKMIEYQLTKEDKLRTIEEWQKKEKTNINFIPLFIFDYLEELALIDVSKESKHEIYERAATMLLSEYRTTAERNGSWKDYNEYCNQYDKGYRNIKGKYVEEIRNLSKKLVAFEFLWHGKHKL